MITENMKTLLAIPIAALTLSSCLDFDVTGDEFDLSTSHQEIVVRQGKVDTIKYQRDITDEEFKAAMAATRDNMKLALGGVYAMRGGKEGNIPVPHQYQYQFSLTVDQYAQYGVIPHFWFQYSGINIISSYAIDLNAYGGVNGSFLESVKRFIPLLNMEQVDNLPEIKATYLLCYDYMALEMADVYGPLPYQDIKTNKQERPFNYDDLQSIYYGIKANMDTIVNCFEYFETHRSPEYKQQVLRALTENLPINNICINGGYKDLDYLKRWANSLKLRMAVHMAKVEPQTAKKWAEEAVASGVIESKEQEMALLPQVSGFTNPMIEIWNTWRDETMSAGFEQVLKAYNHPFLEMIFTKNERIVNSNDPSKIMQPETTQIGILAGAHVYKDQASASNPYNAFSKLNQKCMMLAPLYLMKLSEVCFLRAEGVVRGWNMGGSAKDFYEAGILAGDVQDRNTQLRPYKGMYEAAMKDYMAIDKAIPFTYEDPTGNNASVTSKITVGVKWNEGDTKEVMLEKIITQKYIAGFPMSFEAWVDLRRTGYPRLFDVLNPGDGDGSLKPGDVIRRLPFPDTKDPATMKDVTATGLKALGGDDKQATRLWWDVDEPNFK